MMALLIALLSRFSGLPFVGHVVSQLTVGNQTKEVFPRRSVCEEDGWKITIKFFGVFTEFITYVGSSGDPKGKVIVSGHGVRVAIGNKLFPVNLSKGADNVYKLRDHIINRYNVKPDFALLHKLGRQAFRPYDKYYGLGWPQWVSGTDDYKVPFRNPL